MTPDAELLHQYTETRSEDAFRDLVNRYLPLVYSAAVRQVGGERELAKDVAQSVFIDLARKAGSLENRELLVGWLYTSTRLAASKAVRTEHRRRIREQTAIAQQDMTQSDTGENIELRDELDGAMSKLGSEERDALLLRFFQQKELKEVGAAMGVSEDAARMRINRSLDKLHGILSRRGVVVSASTLAAALATETSVAAPVGLTALITNTALASVATESAVSGTTLTTLKFLVMTKLKTGLITTTLVVCVAIPLVVQHHAQVKLREENDVLQKEVARVGMENSNLSNQLFQAKGALAAVPSADQQTKEILRLRNLVGTLMSQSEKLKSSAPKSAPANQESERDQQFRSRSAFARGLLSAIFTYQGQNQGKLPTSLDQAAPFLKDEFKNQTNYTADQFELVDPSTLSILTNADFGLTIRDRQPWTGAIGKPGRVWAFIRTDASWESTGFFDEDDQAGLAKWEAQAKWEIDYARAQQEQRKASQ